MIDAATHRRLRGMTAIRVETTLALDELEKFMRPGEIVRLEPERVVWLNPWAPTPDGWAFELEQLVAGRRPE